jgi:hypothetical protein
MTKSHIRRIFLEHRTWQIVLPLTKNSFLREGGKVPPDRNPEKDGYTIKSNADPELRIRFHFILQKFLKNSSAVHTILEKWRQFFASASVSMVAFLNVCFSYFPLAKSQHRYRESNPGASVKITDCPATGPLRLSRNFAKAKYPRTPF